MASVSTPCGEAHRIRIPEYTVLYLFFFFLALLRPHGNGVHSGSLCRTQVIRAAKPVTYITLPYTLVTYCSWMYVCTIFVGRFPGAGGPQLRCDLCSRELGRVCRPSDHYMPHSQSVAAAPSVGARQMDPWNTLVLEGLVRDAPLRDIHSVIFYWIN